MGQKRTSTFGSLFNEKDFHLLLDLLQILIQQSGSFNHQIDAL